MIDIALESNYVSYKLVMRIIVSSEVSDSIFTLIHFLGFLMSSVAQSQAEIVTEGIFLRYPVLKEIYDR